MARAPFAVGLLAGFAVGSLAVWLLLSSRAREPGASAAPSPVAADASPRRSLSAAAAASDNDHEDVAARLAEINERLERLTAAVHALANRQGTVQRVAVPPAPVVDADVLTGALLHQCGEDADFRHVAACRWLLDGK